MSYIEDIQNRRNQVRNNIAKGFGCEFVKAQDDELGEIEKAVYADTPQNRKLGRVGQEYHRGRKKQNIGDNEQKEGGEVKKKMSKKELEVSYKKAAYSAPRHDNHADYYKHHYESFKRHQELGGYKKVSGYANNIMTTPRGNMRFKEYANAREKGMSHEEAAKRAYLDMD